MPAVTADYLRLPRSDSPPPHAAERGVVGVTTAPTGLEGEGFPVHRAFAGVPLAQLDPFVHMDQMGEVQYAPGEPKGTPWHPHRGFETVTYMIDGRFQHQDSHGGGGMIENGATQWMTAGAGILHIETPPEDLVVSGGLFHGVQLWVNLPAKSKMIPPAYQSIEADDVILVASADAGALVRVIAGEVGGHRGPGSTHTPITLLHATVSPGALLQLPWDPSFNALVYVLAGGGRMGSQGRPVREWPARRAGPRRLVGGPRRRSAGFPQPCPGGACAGRAAHPGAGRGVRTVRDEHQSRTRASVGGLPGGLVRRHSAQRADALYAGSLPGAHRKDGDLNAGRPQLDRSRRAEAGYARRRARAEMAHVLAPASPLRDSAFQSQSMEVTIPLVGLMLGQRRN